MSESLGQILPRSLSFLNVALQLCLQSYFKLSGKHTSNRLGPKCIRDKNSELKKKLELRLLEVPLVYGGYSR